VGATGFAAMVRFLAAESREAGLEVPAFRSPPRMPGTSRTIRRLRDGAVVAIALRGRETGAVAEDMIEGIVVANRLDADTAESVRRRLRAAVTPADVDLTVVADGGRSLVPRARVAERQTQAA
jgi:hypothetical protein